VTALSTPHSRTHFIITLRDVPDSGDHRQEFGPAHRAHCAAIENRLILAGPTFAQDGTMDGSVIVVNFDTREEAEAWVEADPYVTNGIYRDWTIVLFRNAWPYQGPGSSAN
jgi:hypothetical protein